MFFLKLSGFLLVSALVSTIAIGSANAGESSSLKMSFSDRKISVSPERKSSKPQPSKKVDRNVQRNDRQTGWYWGTVRGANFPSLSATNSNGQKSNWSGSDSFGSLVDFNNLNGFVGYKSSNFRIEGEILYANNAMTIDRQNTTLPIVGDATSGGGQVPVSSGVPVNCKATTFAAILNGYYDIDMGSQIKPFVGAGIGFASTNLKDGAQDWGSASGLTYQLKGGVAYPLSDRQNIYVQYKYINAPAQYVTQDGRSFSTNFSSSNIEFGTKLSF
jgi:opacity protein-like surface antigen